MTSYQPSEYEAKLFQTAVDRALRISDLESALAAMTAERDGLKTELHDLGKQYDAEFRAARVVAEAKLEAVEKVVALWAKQGIWYPAAMEIETALKGEEPDPR